MSTDPEPGTSKSTIREMVMVLAVACICIVLSFGMILLADTDTLIWFIKTFSFAPALAAFATTKTDTEYRAYEKAKVSREQVVAAKKELRHAQNRGDWDLVEKLMRWLNRRRAD